MQRIASAETFAQNHWLDVVATLAAEPVHEHRAVLVASHAKDVQACCQAMLANEAHHDAISGQAVRPSKIAFVCPGQGSQWLGMARDLWTTQPDFRENFCRVARRAATFMEYDLVDELFANECDSHQHQIDVVQPLLFAIEVSLGELWRGWGIEPGAMIGHSMGEVAAYYLARVLSLDDAVRIICLRSQLLRTQTGRGSMLAAELSLSEAGPYITGREDRVAIAVSNSPSSIVLSGDSEALDEIEADLQRQDVFSRRVKVDVASHSPLMDPILSELRTALASVSSQSGSIPIISTVSGTATDGSGLDAGYWVRNLRQTVLFAEGVRKLLDEGFNTFVELSPHPILLSSIEQCIDEAEADAVVVASMRRDESGLLHLLRGAGKLFVGGANLRWSKVFAGGEEGASLPGYVWDRERYWAPNFEFGPSINARSGHPLVGARIDQALRSSDGLWEVDLRPDILPWVGDHAVQGATVASGATLMEMAFAALRDCDLVESCLHSLSFEHPLLLPERSPRRVQIALTGGSNSAEVGVFSSCNGHWQTHLRAKVVASAGDPLPGESSACCGGTEAISKSATPVESLYTSLGQRGIVLGAGVRCLWNLRVMEGKDVEAEVRVPAAAVRAYDDFCLHPVVVEGAMQCACALLPEDGRAYLLTTIESAWRTPAIQDATQQFSCRATPRAVDDLTRPSVDVQVFANDGTLVLTLRGLQFCPVEATASDAPDLPTDWSSRIQSASDPQQRRALVEPVVRRELGAVLNLAPERIDPKKSLSSMGVSSLMTVELRNRLSQVFGIRLSATMAWNYPNLEALMPHIEDKLLTSAMPSHGSPATPPSNAMETPLAFASDPPPLRSVEASLLDELSRIDSLLQGHQDVSRS